MGVGQHQRDGLGSAAFGHLAGEGDGPGEFVADLLFGRRRETGLLQEGCLPLDLRQRFADRIAVIGERRPSARRRHRQGVNPRHGFGKGRQIVRQARRAPVDALDQQRPHGDLGRRRDHPEEPRPMTADGDPLETGGLISEIVGGGQGELALLGDPQQHIVPGDSQVIVRQALEGQGLERCRRHIRRSPGNA